MTFRELGLTVLGAVALTIVLTWPIAARFSDGGRIDSGDGRFSVWNVSWVAHALTTNPWQLYNANIFYPHQNTLAFSEANLIAGIIGIPVWLATKNPHATSNSVILVAFVLGFLCTYALVRHLTGNRLSAAIAGLIVAFCPYVLSHLPHVQLLLVFVMPLVLLQMHRFVDTPTLRRAAWLGGAVGFAGLACAYYGIFAGLMAAIGIIWFGAWSGEWRRWQYWALAASAAAISLVIIAPFFAPYLDIRDGGFERSLEDARTHSVRWRSYLASPVLSHQWLLPLIGTWREVLFPGYLALVFAPIAVWRTFRLPHPAATRQVVGFYVIVAAWAFWSSLGPDAGLYLLMHEWLPFFTMLRAPARFGVIVTLALGVLAGIGLSRMSFDPAPRRPTAVTLAVALLIALRFGTEHLYVAPAPVVTEAHKRLRSLPTAPVVEFPFYATRRDWHRHTEYMLMSTLHWKPLINGYSDHFPAEILAAAPRLAMFPHLDAWQVLRDYRVRYVMVHWHAIDPAERARITEGTVRLRPHMRPIVDAPDVSLYEIVSWPSDLN
jgi:hypothetical protein